MDIPIPFTGEQDASVIHPDMGIRHWRKVVTVGWLSIGWHLQLRYGDVPWSGLHASGVHVSLAWPWEWSEEHIYYDGPHCLRSRGFLRIYRGGDWDCKVCAP